MTLQEVKVLHAYNAWATNRMFETLAHVPEQQYKENRNASFGGLHGTLAHLVGAEKLWLARWIGRTEPMLNTAEVPSLVGLKALWETVGYETAKFIGGMTDKRLQETFVMKTTSGREFTHIYWQAIQHVVNHSTYHRGQLVTLLRQIGITPPQTDLIAFYRETAKVK